MPLINGKIAVAAIKANRIGEYHVDMILQDELPKM